VIAIVTLLLASCSPMPSTAVRLNQDGSVDFVSCIAVDQVTAATAVTTRRTGWNLSIDESTAVSVDLVPPIDHLDSGQVIGFVGLPEQWARLDVYVDSIESGDGAYAYAEREDLEVGEWHWMEENAPLSSSSRCQIDE